MIFKILKDQTNKITLSNFFHTLTLAILFIFLVRCADDNEITKLKPQSKLDSNQIQNNFTELVNQKVKFSNARPEEIDCSGSYSLIFAQFRPQFDGNINIGEDFLIEWDLTTCGGQLPSSFSIFLMKNGWYEGTIGSGLSPDFKTNPLGFTLGNILWMAPNLTNNDVMAPGNGYALYAQADDGQALDYYEFELLPSNSSNPGVCDFSVHPYIDGDYNISFDINNNSTCFLNMEYHITWGDGTSSVFSKSNNLFTLSHQYPFGTASHYNVTIAKYQGSELLSSKTVTVFAKRD